MIRIGAVTEIFPFGLESVDSDKESKREADHLTDDLLLFFFSEAYSQSEASATAGMAVMGQ